MNIKEKVREYLVNSRYSYTSKEIASNLGLNWSSVRSVLTDDIAPKHYMLYKATENNKKIYGIFAEPELDLDIEVLPKAYKYRQAKKSPYLQFWIDTDYERVQVVKLSDMHYGHPASQVGKLAGLIRWILEEDNRYAIGLGDWIEVATKTSVGAGVYTQTLNPNEQAKKMVEMLAPVAHRILYCSTGNHEYRTWKGVGVDLMYWMASMLKIPYIPYQVYADINVNDTLFEMYTNHGATGAITDGGKINAAKRPMEWQYQQPHFMTMGHVHDMNVKKKFTIKRNRRTGELEKRKMYIETTGGFLGYFGTYADMKNYPPSVEGTIRDDLYVSGDYHASI